MEEVGELEINSKNVTGSPQNANRFAGTALEFEYGVRRWWTTELYLDGQSTKSDSTFFTGYRWENRFSVLRHRWLNAVLYFELEDVNEGDKALLEITGNDTVADLAVPARDVRYIRERALESKLILDRKMKGWTIAGNFIAERVFAPEPWEFGYAVGIARPLSRSASSRHCGLCMASLAGGVELYGGLGTTDGFGLRNTSHYLGPALAWSPRNGTTFRFSPNFGLNDASARFLFRFGVSQEVEDFGRAVQNLFR